MDDLGISSLIIFSIIIFSISGVTDEDITAAEEGHEFAFELSQEPIRYIRLKILSTWGGSAFTHPAEVDLYGEVVE